ncbi:methyl-accepting chemotaxis protein [Halarcobacter bivalviorum]|uniref:MCP-domain signal transduction protein n=1 Tax=Halarcobacter bivalviorum TaxID=663364 RepID=A0AAX2ABK1_9BACT|nr:methyl-accepting chemotaxis protein [Halarcobacter bivalviorum]AXH13338.1 MCP-domain signal transduction protein [Halarcobacter bivalviorum]RXK10056.1 hypothetical protein CRV05_06680 [Halarcobacter bivalviorum]
MSTQEIDSQVLQTLLQKAKLLDELKIEDSLNIAQNITNNAKNVNNASKTRLTEIQNIESLVNEFIERSNQIQILSENSLESSKVTSNESENVIILVEKLFNLINDMSTTIDEFSSIIEQLNEKNESITELVQVNNKISMQTNLLSINAAIEASKAKEYGRGFSIVASEVKKLANSSKQSTLDIGNEIDKITSMTKFVLTKKEAVKDLVKNSVNLSKEAIEKLKSLIEVAKENSTNSDTISCNVNEQLQSSDTIKDKITHLVEDTKKAIDGSQNNINLGENLVENLKK